jgi:hypothetical protein
MLVLIFAFYSDFLGEFRISSKYGAELWVYSTRLELANRLRFPIEIKYRPWKQGVLEFRLDCQRLAPLMTSDRDIRGTCFKKRKATHRFLIGRQLRITFKNLIVFLKPQGQLSSLFGERLKNGIAFSHQRFQADGEGRSAE